MSSGQEIRRKEGHEDLLFLSSSDGGYRRWRRMKQN